MIEMCYYDNTIDRKLMTSMFHKWNLQNKKNANFLREFFLMMTP